MSDSLSRTLRAISDPTRRDIFHVLLASEQATPLKTISDRFDMSRQGVTKHLRVLEDAGLVQIDQQGRRSFLAADAEPLEEVNQWVKVYEKFWDKSLGDLVAFLDKKSGR